MYIKYFDTFTGIGGFTKAIQDIFSDAECVGFSEVDKYASSIYKYHYPNHKAYGDITKLDPTTLPDFDILVGGFPCQAFSIAGKRRGFEDTRGTLFFDLARILKIKRPSYFIFENVKGLLSHDKGNTFATILSTITELGYDCQWQVLNSKNFGVPQNRERVFIVGNLRGKSRPKVFPIGETSQKSLAYVGAIMSENNKKWLDDNKQFSRNFPQGQRVYDSSGISSTLASQAGGLGAKTGLYAMQWGRTEKCRKLRKEAMKNGVDYTPFSDGCRELIPNPDKDHIGAITAQAVAKDSLLGNDKIIRRLTPTECERLQAFPDGWTESGEGKTPISDTQRYKCLGNAVTVNVVKEIVKRLFEIEKHEVDKE